MCTHVCSSDRVKNIKFANRVTDESTLAFILRLYRQDNKAGFIKAFSDSPDHCTGRYSHLDRIMRNLFIKNLYVWPRYVHVVCVLIQYWVLTVDDTC